MRCELAGVRYEYNVLGTRGPRKMTALLPGTNGNGQNYVFRPEAANDSILDRYCRHSHCLPPASPSCLGVRSLMYAHGEFTGLARSCVIHAYNVMLSTCIRTMYCMKPPGVHCCNGLDSIDSTSLSCLEKLLTCRSQDSSSLSHHCLHWHIKYRMELAPI